MLLTVLLLSKELLPRENVPMRRVRSISHCHHQTRLLVVLPPHPSLL